MPLLRQHENIAFNGLIYAPQPALSIGQFIDDLEILAKAGEPADFVDTVQYLPLR